MSPQPFVDPPDPHADLDYCPACSQFAWRDLGHRCPADDCARFRRGLLFGLGICAVFWAIAGAGVWRWLS